MPVQIIKTQTKPLVTRHGSQVGTFTLHRVAPEWDGHTLYLVEVDAKGLNHFAGPSNAERYAGRTIGALTGVRSNWAVTAYLDRDAFLAGREGWNCPLDVRAQAHGVRILLTYYHLLHYPNGERTPDLLTARECKRL
uniref:hypothetical protein n=1 Tax=Nonomuraea sp. CA-251285 TaxID=3240002 RepID=UPI003F493E39